MFNYDPEKKSHYYDTLFLLIDDMRNNVFIPNTQLYSVIIIIQCIVYFNPVSLLDIYMSCVFIYNNLKKTQKINLRKVYY